MIIVKIDVIICTKNSGKIFEECLESIFREIPICHLIVEDAYSTDDTIKILEKFKQKYKDIIVNQTNAKLGKARELGISEVDADWFAFIDSDVILPEKWCEKMLEHLKLNNDIGAIESNHIHHYPDNTPIFPEFKGVINQVHNGKRTDTRALTIATLLKTNAVNGISIPDDLQIYEDEFIRRYVESQGYIWFKASDPIVDHYPTPRPWRDAYLAGVYSARYHFISPVRIILVSIFFPVKLLYFWIRSGSLRASINSIIYNFYMLKGLFCEILGF